MSQRYTVSKILVSDTAPDKKFPLSDYVDNTIAQKLSVAEKITQGLEDLGVVYAFGLMGGGMAHLWRALSNSNMQVLNFRHEGGAAFAACEAYFASGSPSVVFTTTGPGITNTLTGLSAARDEGAKVILLSACTSPSQRGRRAIQETTIETLSGAGIFTSGSIFNYATIVESEVQLPQIFRQLALGLAQPGGFIAHLSIPSNVQSILIDNLSLPQLDFSGFRITPSQLAIAKSIELLSSGPFAIWVGFGARDAAEEIRQLAEKTGAAVMCSPRGKGIFPEDHHQFVGVTGWGGQASVITYMQEQTPLHTLVLGTRLGEATSFWRPEMVPPGGFVHVDINPSVPGMTYPQASSFPVISDIKAFVKELLKQWPDTLIPVKSLSLPNIERKAIEPSTDNLVRPEILLEAIQKVIVEGSDAIVISEAGNSFIWANHLLRFSQPNRYRVSTGIAAMGQAVTGVVGAALAHQGKAVAIVGDGAMLMNNEISTAVRYKIPAVWIVLNDACYNMCHQGMTMLGFKGADATIPQTDFVMIARGMGAEGIRVSRESELVAALEQARASNTPFVVDVAIDPNQYAPSQGRNQMPISETQSSAAQSLTNFR